MASPNSKTDVVRMKECLRLRKELNRLGLDAVESEALEGLYKAMNVFIKEGVESEGSIELVRIGKRLVYKLTNQSTDVCDIVIKA